MTKLEIIRQLESLVEEACIHIEPDCEQVWLDDKEALESAIDIIKGTMCSIDSWWDRHTRSWVVQVFFNGDEIDCIYVGNKADRDRAISDFKEYYHIGG